MKNKLLKSCLCCALIIFTVLASLPATVLASQTTKPIISITSHVQKYGWLDYTGALTGTTGESKRMEALEINIDVPAGVVLKYRAHVQKYGWMDWVTADNQKGTNYIGTTGQSKRIEAIQMVLEGSDTYTLKYRAHVQKYGWMNWVVACDTINSATLIEGNYAGTTGESKRIESIEVVVVEKSKTNIDNQQSNKTAEEQAEAQRKAEEERQKIEAEAKAKEEEEKRQIEEARQQAEVEAQAKAEEAKKAEEAMQQAEAEAKAKAEEARRAEEAMQQAEAEAQAKAEEAEKAKKANQPLQAKAMEEEARKAEEARQQAEAEAKAKAEEARKAEEAMQQAEAEAQAKAEEAEKAEQARQRAEAQAKHVHSYSEWQIIVEPTCVSRGKKTRTCTTCGKVDTQDIIDPNAHKIVKAPELNEEATCTQRGRVNGSKCAYCNQEFFNITQPLGHLWSSEVVVDREPTCTEAGQQSIHCLRDGCTEIKDVTTIKPTGHVFKLVDTKATCSTDGMRGNVCEKCGFTTDAVVTEKAKGHSFTKYVSDGNATCTTEGTKTAICDNCGAKDTITDVGSKLSHKFQTLNDKVSPTCEQDGREASKKCSVCGTIEQGKVIKALGHTYSLVSATHSATEKADEILTCTRCHMKYQTGSKVIFGKGHKWDSTGKYCIECCGENGDQCSNDSKVWWSVWKSNNRSGAIWWAGFMCQLNVCDGFTNSYGKKVDVLVEGRRGSNETMSMKAPAAKDGYVFAGWYDLATNQKVTTNGQYTKVDSAGTTITVHWRDMDKGFEARYTPAK